MERTRDALEAIVKRLNQKYPKRRFEVDSTATYGHRIVFEQDGQLVVNPVRDLLGLSPVSPVVYGLSMETARLILDANGLREPGYNAED